MSDFLLELRCEEIPARMQKKARADLEKLFVSHIADAGLKADSITTFSTPRRLALIARGLPDQTEAVSEERKGPAANAPEQALAGFLRSTGLSRDDLVEREVKGKAVLFAIIEKPGQPTPDILAGAIPAIIAAFPWPKSQRWGADSISSSSMKWVRPMSSIIALFGDEVVDFTVHNISSGRLTMGHRFHASGEISIENADDYTQKLRDAHVIVDHEERQNIVREGAKKAADAAGLELVEDEGLVIENAGLTEWPVPLLGRYDEAFLDVPEEVIQLTTRINQKYFVVRDADGSLANAFICTANIDAIDGGKEIVAGNEKVLAARLGDAKFFWELDQKTKLADHAKKLSNIVFHEKLGTVADKVERVAKLARWLCEQGIVDGDADLAEQAAHLCKADLVTEMVGEFPELQGLMGGYYAAKEGLPIEVSNAIRDHYKPVGQNDDVPTAPVTVAVSLADKLDTIIAFYVGEMPPTGSKDPFALRRSCLGASSLTVGNNIRLPIINVVQVVIESAINFDEISEKQSEYVSSIPIAFKALAGHYIMDFLDSKTGLYETQKNIMDKTDYSNYINKKNKDLSDGKYEYDNNIQLIADEVLNFFADRLKVQQKEAGVRHDLIDAVFALGGEDDLVRLLARVHALQDFVTTDDGVNLLAGYKRASNILKKEGAELTSSLVTPAKAGVQSDNESNIGLDSRVRGNDDVGRGDAVVNAPSDEPSQSTYLQNALNAAEPQASAAIASEDFEAAMTALAALRKPIDAFFEGVMVNDEDAAKKQYRLGLLSRFREAVHKVADFSKIEG